MGILIATVHCGVNIRLRINHCEAFQDNEIVF